MAVVDVWQREVGELSNRKFADRFAASEGHGNTEKVKCVSFFGPKSEYVVSGSSFGRMFIWKKKGGELVRVTKADVHTVKCIESHPRQTTVFASCGIEDIKIWTPNAIDNAMLPKNYEEVPDDYRRRSFNIGRYHYFSFPGGDEENICAFGGLDSGFESYDEER